MYGKIFDSIYKGTLRANWMGLVTFQQLIVLKDQDGIVDMTPDAISGTTGIPLDIISAGLQFLSKPDVHSKSKAEEGRRIILIDPARPWGWQIVNHQIYRELISQDERREYMKNLMRDRRNKVVSNSLAPVSSELAVLAHTDTDTDTDKTTLSRSLLSEAKEVLLFLNEKTKRSYRPVDANINPIISRLKSGATVQDCKTVIMRKWHDWNADEKMEKYLRPKTLFAAANFENYLGECV